MSDTVKPPAEPRMADWLLKPLLANRSLYIQVILAAIVTNLFSLATSLFSMTVYDRVVPNNAVESLTALTIGVAIVLACDFMLRTLRAYFTDIAGAEVDRRIGTALFQKLLAMRLDPKRRSTGAFAGMLREFETLREFFTSATMTAFVDVPFIALFLFVIALIGGWIVIVPMAVVPLVILVGALTRPALDRMSAKMITEGLSKQGVLVETVGSLDSVKASMAGPMLAQRWKKALMMQADSGLKQRLVGTIAMTTATTAQNLSYIGTIVFGVHLIGAGDLTTGGLVACSILSSRCVAPLGQIAQLLTRVSSTRMAYRHLDSLMKTPNEADEGVTRRNGISGGIEFRDVRFRYAPDSPPALNGVSFKIEPGERVALLGRIGSGKSTLFRLIVGLHPPESGGVLIDGVDIRQFHPDDIRRNVGITLQEAGLLSGSVRDNIALGRPEIDHEELVRAATVSGTHSFMSNLPNGYDLKLADRGEGLSGGQRQSISLARAVAGRPPVLLLDEPSSAMDPTTESGMIDRLSAEVEGRTVLIVTHRPPLLRLVKRIILMDAGKIVADGPRDEILKRMGLLRPAEVRPEPKGAAA
ncbi:type I secretion system permease/ATPase [Flavisphingomonas formosensis]|uniref:type I secretion system permease/ATPase n=1 Tax=Flavisphingomonas formosensis TaxID=861534 RepID=UPI0012FCE4DF|nr:type I secretion system permease/ATPase [Sphingomonas formosensis]